MSNKITPIEDIFCDVPSIVHRMTAVIDGKTNADLARFLDISRKTISGWVSRNSVPYQYCIEICCRVDASLDFLILGKESKPQNYSALGKVVSNINQQNSVVSEEKMPTFEENLRRMEQATQRVRLATRSVDNAGQLNPATMSQVLDLAYHHNMELPYIKKVLELMIQQTGARASVAGS